MVLVEERKRPRDGERRMVREREFCVKAGLVWLAILLELGRGVPG